MRLIPIVTLLLVLTVTDGLGPGDTQILRCRCIIKEKRRIKHLIKTVVVIPPNSHCSEIEIIATLKNERKICLDPKAWWVKVLLQRNKPKQITLGTNHTTFSTVYRTC